MDLESLHREVSQTIAKLDLARIWPGFKPLKFALYDDANCFFDGRYVEKTDAFCANTSIVYEGEQIAIWNISEELERSVLASKMVHEMFHGFQGARGWDCWPNEMEALYKYEYDAENLSIKLRENELLLSLLNRFDADAFREILSLRKLRAEKFPYQFSYEIKTEEIEGTANFVEWQALKQLDARKAAELTEHMRAAITKAEYLFPIRISCYYSGALMVNAALAAGVYSFDAAQRPVTLALFNGVTPSDGEFPGRQACQSAASAATDAFMTETEGIIKSALDKNEIVLNGPLELVYVNIYDARCRNGFLTSTFFLMYRDGGENKMIPGNFVIKMRDEKTIETVYKWEQP